MALARLVAKMVLFFSLIILNIITTYKKGYNKNNKSKMNYTSF